MAQRASDIPEVSSRTGIARRHDLNFAVELLIARVYETVRRAWPFLLLSGLLGGAIAARRVHRQPTVYDSTAQLLLSPNGSSNLALVYSGSVRAPKLNIATEAYLFLSDAVLARVAKQLDLANDPRFWSLASPGNHWDPDQPAVRAATVARMRGLLYVGFGGSDETLKEIGGDDDDATKASKRRRPYSGRGILTVTFSSLDPVLGAQIVHAQIDNYSALTFEMRRDAMLRISAELTGSMKDLEQKVERERGQLLELQHSLGVVALRNGESQQSQELRSLEQASRAAQAQVRAFQAATLVPPGTTYPRASGMTTQMAVPDDFIFTALVESRRELAEQSVALGPDYPLIRQLKAKSAELESSIQQNRERMEQEVKDGLALHRSIGSSILGQLYKERQKGLAIQQATDAAGTLQVNLARDSELYYVLVNNVKTAVVDSGYGSVNVEVLREPESPGISRPKDYAAAAIYDGLWGLCAGLGIAFVFLAASNKRVRKTERLEQYLDMPCLGRVTLAPEPRPGPEASGRARLLAVAASHGIGHLCDAILLSPVANPCRRIVIEGAARKQGTTTLVLAVAFAFAKTGRRVLVIDADVNKPAVHRYLGLDGRVGLTNVLSGQVALEDALNMLPDLPGLHVLCCGPAPPESMRLLESVAMQDLLERASAMFDFILVDASFGSHTDGLRAIRTGAALNIAVLRNSGLVRRDLDVLQRTFAEQSSALAGFVQTLRG